MRKPTLVEQVAEFLRLHTGERFSVSQIASALLESYPEIYREKLERSSRIQNEKELLGQVTSEIGASKNALAKAGILYQDNPKPRRYWFEERGDSLKAFEEESEEGESSAPERLLEHDLYPLLGEYLSGELGLYCHRIDEKRSKNSFGSGGNVWLHPDMVGVQILDSDFDGITQECLRGAGASRVRWWSFEVKRELNGSNARKSFFQAVSNSSWAHEGYLVASAIAPNVDSELKMLSNLHGIGIMVLNVENPRESEIIYPARSRAEVDWHSMDRIVRENSDFKEVVESVSIYYQTGKPRVLERHKGAEALHKGKR